jgi:shikimate dehydrogenase
VYLSFEVGPGDLKHAISGLKALGICGFNVTVPYKEAVIKYLDRLDKEASIIGAVNTVINRVQK